MYYITNKRFVEISSDNKIIKLKIEHAIDNVIHQCYTLINLIPKVFHSTNFKVEFKFCWSGIFNY